MVQDASAHGAGAAESLPGHQWAEDHPPQFTMALPAQSPRATRQMDCVTTAFVSVALARLERDHVALLSALCELESSAAQPASATNVFGDTISREILLALLREDLHQTQQALQLAADGMLGLCEVCHRPLSTAVLLTRPATTRCSTCVDVAQRSAQVH